MNPRATTWEYGLWPRVPRAPDSLKITLLTPGTGHFYCGSCLRDSALAKALRARGHDVFVVPLYLPFVLEDDSTPKVAEESPRVFLGGVNMYLQQKLPWLGRLPVWLMGLLDSPRLLRWLSSKSEMTQARELGAMIVSTMRGDQGRQRAEVERLVRWLGDAERPDALCLSNGMLLGLAPRLREVLDIPIYCTLQGEAPFLDTLREPFLTDAWQAMRERASAINGFIAVSHYYGQLMGERLGVPSERLHVVHNGIELDGLEPAAEASSTPVLGYLARMCADKGLHTLIDAYCELKKSHADL
ncbi:MAG: glycosyltransferase involved in cell wall biosynthesis, partial [Chlamydiales bacterium]